MTSTVAKKRGWRCLTLIELGGGASLEAADQLSPCWCHARTAPLSLHVLSAQPSCPTHWQSSSGVRLCQQHGFCHIQVTQADLPYAGDGECQRLLAPPEALESSSTVGSSLLPCCRCQRAGYDGEDVDPVRISSPQQLRPVELFSSSDLSTLTSRSSR